MMELTSCFKQYSCFGYLVAFKERLFRSVSHDATEINNKVLLRLLVFKDNTVRSVASIASVINFVISLNGEFHLVLAAREREIFGVSKVMGVLA